MSVLRPAQIFRPQAGGTIGEAGPTSEWPQVPLRCPRSRGILPQSQAGEMNESATVGEQAADEAPPSSAVSFVVATWSLQRAGPDIDSYATIVGRVECMCSAEFLLWWQRQAL